MAAARARRGCAGQESEQQQLLRCDGAAREERDVACPVMGLEAMAALALAEKGVELDDGAGIVAQATAPAIGPAAVEKDCGVVGARVGSADGILDVHLRHCE